MGRVDYTDEDWSTAVTARAMSSGTLSNNYIQCSSGCPVGLPAPTQTIDNNYGPGYFYLDYSLSRKFMVGESNVEA
ncbi:MAG: hypothetical protein ACYCZX_11455, partial [Rhodospirillaceae bacterium]